jgi:hypothetical protein
MRIAIVTAIIGSNEKLSDPPIFHSDCDYVAFVDRMHENIRFWKQILVGSYSENAFFRDRIDSKIYKILPEVFLPEYDFYAWVDAAHAYQTSPKKLIAQAGRFDYLVFRHGKRNSVTSELGIVAILGYDRFSNLIRFFLALKRTGDFDCDLFELTAFIKRRSDITRFSSISWLEYIFRYSSRDQLSFPLVVKRFNLELKYMRGKINTGQLFDNCDVIQFKEHIPSDSGKASSVFRRLLIKILVVVRLVK